MATKVRPVTSTGGSVRRERLAGIASVGAGLAVALLYVVRVRRYPFVVDDAYISFRYARHLAEGTGLVWNPGERVEGYTNFLWVVLVALGMKLGLPPELVASTLGALAGLGLLLVLAAFGARRLGWGHPWIWVAPALLVAMRPFPTWANGGLETMLFAALVTSGFVRLVVERERGRPPFGSSLLLSLAVLVRPDGVLFLALAGALLVWETRSSEDRVRTWLAFAAPVGLVVAHVAFRSLYYGSPLPNTFYARAVGAHWFRGADFLRLFQRDTGLLWFAVPALLGALARRERADVLFASALLAQALYLMRVGGDIFEFRLLVPVLPLLAWLIADLPRSLPTSLSARAILSVVIVGGVAALTTARSAATEDSPVRGGVASVQTMRTYSHARLEQGQRLADLVDMAALPADLRIATSGAGALPYVTGLYTIDVLGLTDATIAARAPPNPKRRIGHEKHASRGYLESRSIDMVDVAGGFVFAGEPTSALLTRAAHRLRRFNATAGDEPLDLLCRQVPGGVLLFGSGLPQSLLDERFGGLPACPADWTIQRAAARRTHH